MNGKFLHGTLRRTASYANLLKLICEDVEHDYPKEIYDKQEQIMFVAHASAVIITFLLPIT